jgi:hypothetical protein
LGIEFPEKLYSSFGSDLHKQNMESLIMQRTLWLAAVIVLIAGCSLDTASPLKSDVFNSPARPHTVVDEEKFQEGRTLAVTRCAQCHRFFYPTEFSKEEWRKILNGKARKLTLSHRQVESLKLFFQASSVQNQ